MNSDPQLIDTTAIDKSIFGTGKLLKNNLLIKAKMIFTKVTTKSFEEENKRINLS